METFDEDSSTATVVTVEEKLEEVYNALFATEYGLETNAVSVGNIRFEQKTKDLLLKTAGLLSEFTEVGIG